MARGRPIMIPILRIAGWISFLAAALFLYVAVSAQFMVGALVLAGAATATGLFLLGFATNLVILDDIRRHLKTTRSTD